jgi:hypothetical protein|tara:strand:+ start:7774 stop:8346 length:573 start_codon:yes stop_codon:yes gene_type:complete
MRYQPDFTHVKTFSEPYPHSWIAQLFPTGANREIQSWLDGCGCWEHTVTDFYEQYEFSLQSTKLPPSLEFVICGEVIAALTDWMMSTFTAPELVVSDVVLHCLHPGHKIGIHNDHTEDGESYRLLIQLSDDLVGGDLLMFEGMDARSLKRIIKPKFGTALAFAISEKSYHAVSKVEKGLRYTLIYSFCRK